MGIFLFICYFIYFFFPFPSAAQSFSSGINPKAAAPVKRSAVSGGSGAGYVGLCRALGGGTVGWRYLHSMGLNQSADNSAPSLAQGLQSLGLHAWVQGVALAGGGDHWGTAAPRSCCQSPV